MMKKIMILVTGGVLLTMAPLFSATFVVTNVNDAGPGSLRQAMQMANTNIAVDTIAFAIPGPGVQTITPLSQLPILTEMSGVYINGLSQPGAAAGANPPSTANLLIQIDGSLAGNSHGIWIQSNFNTITGLIINRFQGNGIYINGLPEAATNVIYCNFGITDCPSKNHKLYNWHSHRGWRRIRNAYHNGSISGFYGKQVFSNAFYYQRNSKSENI